MPNEKINEMIKNYKFYWHQTIKKIKIKKNYF